MLIAVIVGVFIILGLSLAKSVEAQEVEECVLHEQYISDLKTSAGEYVLVEVARDLRGGAAIEFAELTGWQGPAPSRVTLVIGIDDRNGFVYPTAFVVVYDAAGCIKGVASMPTEQAAEVMTMLEEKHAA
jgi:hypothetical protein